VTRYGENMVRLLNQKFIAAKKFETAGQRWPLHDCCAALLAMALAVSAAVLPISAKAQTSSTPQPLTPQTAPAYPYQATPAPQAYPYWYPYPYYPYPSWRMDIHGDGVIRGDGDGLPQFRLALAGALPAASVAPFSAPVSGASALATPGFSIPGLGSSALPMRALVAVSAAAAADSPSRVSNKSRGRPKLALGLAIRGSAA
jgi:hypothetical protein